MSVSGHNRLRLDTHVFLWWRVDSPRLREEARAAISRADLVYVFVASAWEVAIKMAFGKLELPAPLEQGVFDSGFERLAIAFSHAQALLGLPMHHRDPFDRMLVVQAQEEGLTLVTHDDQLRPYDVDVLWT